jgi:hypothetical protein
MSVCVRARTTTATTFTINARGTTYFLRCKSHQKKLVLAFGDVLLVKSRSNIKCTKLIMPSCWRFLTVLFLEPLGLATYLAKINFFSRPPTTFRFINMDSFFTQLDIQLQLSFKASLFRSLSSLHFFIFKSTQIILLFASAFQGNYFI